jgi:hypothetical protein
MGAAIQHEPVRFVQCSPQENCLLLTAVVVFKPFLPTFFVSRAESSRMIGGADEGTITERNIVRKEVDRYDIVGRGRSFFFCFSDTSGGLERDGNYPNPS